MTKTVFTRHILLQQCAVRLLFAAGTDISGFLPDTEDS